MHDGLAMAVETKIMAKVDEFTQTKLSFVMKDLKFYEVRVHETRF